MRPAMRKPTVVTNYWNGDTSAWSRKTDCYEEVFSFSQNRFSYLLAASIPNFKLLIDLELPEHVVQKQLLFYSSLSTIKWKWAESKAT